jgi:hypothetical protein
MKMTIAALRFPAAFLALALTALTRPAMAEIETRTTEPFHAISFEGSWTVDVVVGSERSIKIEGDKDILPLVETVVEGGKLRIRVVDHRPSLFSRHDRGNLTAHIVVPELTAFTLQGSGNASVKGFAGGTTQITLSGSGALTAAGNLDTLALVVNGSGQADLSRLVAAKASATINGSGDATINPSQSLAAVVNGSGHLTYLGANPRVTSVVHGSGQIEKQ